MKPITYSKHHRVFVARPNIMALCHLNGLVFFMERNTQGIADSYPPNLDDGVQALTTNTPDKPIRGRFISRNYGDGLNDSIVSHVILETIPRRQWLTHNYASSPETSKDPILIVELRSAAWAETNGTVPATGYKMDLVANTMAAQGGRNIWHNFAQTPNDPDYNILDTIVFNPDDNDNFESNNAAQPMIWRESIVLNAPITSRFRRMKIEFVSYLSQVVRSLQVYYRSSDRRSG